MALHLFDTKLTSKHLTISKYRRKFTTHNQKLKGIKITYLIAFCLEMDSIHIARIDDF